jgi:hypothetical protein
MFQDGNNEAGSLVANQNSLLGGEVMPPPSSRNVQQSPRKAS